MPSILVILLNQVEKKAYPSFDTFTIEEEEGSGISTRPPFSSTFLLIKQMLIKVAMIHLLSCLGGYGTVYRARRTTDGKRLAIKCK